MPINDPQEKLMVAYLQGGNAKNIKFPESLEQMLNAIKRVENSPLEAKEEKVEED